MMNHRRQSVHNRDVCIQLYRGVCRPFIISGQSLQKHSRTNIRLPPSLSCSNSTSRCALVPQSLAPTHYPSFLPLCPSSASTLHLLYPSHSPSTLLVQPTPPSPLPTVCFMVEDTIIYSFVFPSLPVQSIFTGKYQVALEIKIYFRLFLFNCFYC